MPNPLAALLGAMRGRAPVPEKKESRVAPMIALHMQGRPVWTPRDYAALADEGYRRNAIAYRCVRMIAEAAASLPWLLYDGDRELSQHPLLDLIERPNEGQSGADFFESWYSFLEVAGNSYMELVEVEGAPRELYVLRPDRMKAVPGRAGWP
ncbi:MAG TPA: phage portal protein, partial [Rhodobiaceae bacterium]|nr:phage portal protein [Rhodobiaceae bacterium]